MNYFDKITDDLDKIIPGEDIQLLRYYALLVLTRGVNTTLENVHDAWSAWETGIIPDHRSLIPFSSLTVEVQELDRKYADAIRKVAEAR
jgi:hypothetical protein